MISLSFWVWVTLAIAYLLAVAFIGSALMAVWVRSMDRKREAIRVKQRAADAVLSRYHHRSEHTCGLIQKEGHDFVHLDVRCVYWTRYIRRLEEVARGFETAQRKKEPSISPALNH